MNKEAIGKFLKTLRKEKKLTQEQFSKEFGYIYSDATISKWEKGKSVPNIDDLKQEVNFEEKYFIYNNEWLSRYDDDDLYNIREEQELLIETRFKELLKKMVGEGLSLSDDKEFDFIVTHFYQIFLPAVESIDEKAYRNLGLGECAYL